MSTAPLPKEVIEAGRNIDTSDKDFQSYFEDRALQKIGADREKISTLGTNEIAALITLLGSEIVNRGGN